MIVLLIAFVTRRKCIRTYIHTNEHQREEREEKKEKKEREKENRSPKGNMWSAIPVALL